MKYGMILMLLLVANIGKAAPEGGRFGFHGMVVYGSGPYFLDHIPMLMAPHNAQVIVSAHLIDAKGNLVTVDLSQQAYSFEPAGNFSLDDLMAGRLKQIDGTIHRGSFEQGGEVVPGLENVQVEISTILLARNLPAASTQQQMKVGEGNNSFVVNIITPERNFQQITNMSTKKILWCVTGPDFVNACP